MQEGDVGKHKDGRPAVKETKTPEMDSEKTSEPKDAGGRKGRWAFLKNRDLLTDAAALATLLTMTRAGPAIVNRYRYPLGKQIVPLHRIIRNTSRRLEKPIVDYKLNPYSRVTASTSLIFQGPNRSGKTTLLAEAIPWWQRLWYPRGLYLNGAEGRGVDSFEKWQTSQLFGTTVAAGSEIKRVLTDYNSKQWIRGLFATFGAPQFLHPRIPYIVVDQFEELLKRYGDQVVEWANTLTNQQVRDNLAYVIFVVNSEYGTQTLLNLNQGIRFTVLELTPVESEEAGRSGFEVDYYDTCQKNPGLYKLAKERGVSDKNLPGFVDRTITRWKGDYHVPYPLKTDHAWYDLNPTHVKPELLRLLKADLEKVVTADGTPEYTKEEVDHRLQLVATAMKDMQALDIIKVSQEGWQKRGVPKDLTYHVKKVLASPIPEPTEK